jgi:hypothetical protein
LQTRAACQAPLFNAGYFYIFNTYEKSYFLFPATFFQNAAAFVFVAADCLVGQSHFRANNPYQRCGRRRFSEWTHF